MGIGLRPDREDVGVEILSSVNLSHPSIQMKMSPFVRWLMYDTLLSVCLFVAGLCTAATLLMQHPARSLGGPEVAIVDKGAPSTRTEVAMTVEASAKPPLQVPAPPKTAKKPEDPTPKDVD